MIGQLSRLPSKPQDPVATLDHGIYVTVEWTEPEDNGGTDITGYVIKYSYKDRDVNKYGELPVDENTTNFQFTHQLNAFVSYQFAVAAVNAAGRGEFSEFTNYVLTSSSKCCYNIIVMLASRSTEISIFQCTQSAV